MMRNLTSETAAWGGWLAPLLALAVCAGPVNGQTSGPKIEPAAMGSAYNPLRWDGENARFAVDQARQSRCETELSGFVAWKSANRDVQNLAVEVHRDEEKVHRKLTGMARTFDFRLPHRREEDCADSARLRELTGKDLDEEYLAHLLKAASTDITRYTGEVAEPRGPNNWSLWKFAQDGLRGLHEQEGMIKAVKKRVEAGK